MFHFRVLVLLGSVEDIHGDAFTGNVAWAPPHAMSNHWVRIGDQEGNPNMYNRQVQIGGQEFLKCAAPEAG